MPVDYNAPTMALWAAVEKTDPKFVKPITGKQYKGSSPNPHWIKQRLTEQFGPAGHGWGVRILDQQFVTVGIKTMHYCTIELWYLWDGKRGAIEECGGTELGGVRKSSGEAYADEDAPKKSVTDAFVKAASAIGFAADIFLGRWDDNKYVDQREQEEGVARKLADQQQREAEQNRLKADLAELQQDLDECGTPEAFGELRIKALAMLPKLKASDLGTLRDALTADVKKAAARFANHSEQKAA